MKGKIAILKCSCGKDVCVDSYELMAVRPKEEGGGYTNDWCISKAVCSCGKVYEVQIEISVNGVSE